MTEADRDAVTAMLEPRRVAIVGASARPGSFGHRMVTEVARSTRPLELHLVNPRYDEIEGRACLPSLEAVDGPVDLVLMGVPDAGLLDQVRLAAGRGDRSAIVFGSAVSPDPSRPGLLRDQVAATARAAGMAVCGGGCMGFVNIEYGVRAIGYVEADQLPGGPVAFVSHSGSAFSALLRSHRRIGFTLAVSAGQELVTTAAHYLGHALDRPETKVVALLLETMRSPELLRDNLIRAADADVPVVALTVGSSGPGAAMVAAHSGALAGGDGAWEALFDATGVLRACDLDELADTVELFAAGRRPRAGARGVATVHDSGAERAMVVDLADAEGVPFAPLAASTVDRLADLLDPGLHPTNPLDVWGTGADTRELFGQSLQTMAGDPDVAVTALAVDLVTEYDGDLSYPLAVKDVWSAVDHPLALLSTMHSALDQSIATELRAAGVPVLEGARSGLVALGHLASYGERRRAAAQMAAGAGPVVDAARRDRWRSRLDAASSATGIRSLDAATAFALLADYDVPVVPTLGAASADDAVAAAERLGWPVAVKTDAPGIAHKSDAGGVHLALRDAPAVRAAYADLAGRLGPQVTVSAMAEPGLELALGIVRDPLLGPLVVVASGGVLVELLDDRVVALPPVSAERAGSLLGRLRADRLLAGYRGGAAAERASVAAAIAGLSQLAVELGDRLDAVDVNPLFAGPDGALGVDALVLLRP